MDPVRHDSPEHLENLFRSFSKRCCLITSMPPNGRTSVA